MHYVYQNYQLTNSRLHMTRRLGAVSLTIGRISRAHAASGAAWRRFSAWGGKIVAALRDPEPQSPEDYERELRERVFHPPQA
jgi:hypothetical protein